MPRVRKFGKSESRIYSLRLPVAVVETIHEHGLQDRVTDAILRAVRLFSKRADSSSPLDVNQ